MRRGNHEKLAEFARLAGPLRRTVCCWLAAAFPFVLGCGATELPVGAPIIIVDIDTLRADHLGCYGYERATSPRIDAFSREAVRFEWVFSQAPNTGPSQASILTSLYPSTHGRIGWHDVLKPEVVTLAERLKEDGYATAAFVDGGMMVAEFGYTQGFDIYDDKAGGVARIDGKARAWLQNRATNSSFLLLIHSYDVHGPYEKTPEPFKSMFLEGVERPDPEFVDNMFARIRKSSMSRLSPQGVARHSLTPLQVEYAKAIYDGGIRHVDDWFGDFIDFLKEQDLYDKSIIVIVSDHGDEFEEHDALLHDRIYAPVTHIPLMIRFPGGALQRVVSETVQAIDVMPTLLEAVGTSLPQRIHGQSLLPLIRGSGEYSGLAISESPFHGRRIAVATPDTRLIYTVEQDRSELYDYRADPLEAIDLSSERPETVERLREGVERWQSLVKTSAQQAAEAATVDETTIENLRALGYLDGEATP